MTLGLTLKDAKDVVNRDFGGEVSVTEFPMGHLQAGYGMPRSLRRLQHSQGVRAWEDREREEAEDACR